MKYVLIKLFPNSKIDKILEIFPNAIRNKYFMFVPFSNEIWKYFSDTNNYGATYHLTSKVGYNGAVIGYKGYLSIKNCSKRYEGYSYLAGFADYIKTKRNGKETINFFKPHFKDKEYDKNLLNLDYFDIDVTTYNLDQNDIMYMKLMDWVK